MDISRAPDFEKWFSRESLKSQAQIVARLARIQIYNHFGDYKLLGEDLLELRWKSGRRVYFTIYRRQGKTCFTSIRRK